MKRILALVLAAAMLLTCCSALAESTMVEYDDMLSFRFVVPEGYAFDSSVDDGIVFATIHSDNSEMVNFVFVIGQDEEHEELPRLNDLDDEAKAQFVLDLVEDLYNPTYGIQTTGLGTEVVVVEECDAEFDSARLTTLFYGCVITLYVYHEDGATITEDELAAAMQLMTDLEFVVAE